MKCATCGKDFELSKDLNGEYHFEDDSYFECVKCRDTFCPEHLNAVLYVKKESDLNTNITKESKIRYVLLCDNCKDKI